jgi:hypothetical protein
MTEPGETPQAFYTKRLPEQWNRALRDQEQLAERAARQLQGMRAVHATICVEVREGDGERFYLNVAEGSMSADPEPAQPPFLTVVQDGAAFRRLSQEAGDSAMALLGGLSGLAGEMKLTKARMDLLADVSGSLRFEVTGPDGFTLLTCFGPGPAPEQPDTTLRVSPEAYADLREGRLDPQNAFMGGQIQVEGDMQLAMQLALAAMSPD